MMMMSGSGGVTQTHEPILSKLDRLDHLMRNLEEIRVVAKNNNNNNNNNNKMSSSSPRSCSSPSTPSSLEFSPRSRSMNEAIMEMERKGSLLDRLDHMEERLLKVCTQLEQGLLYADNKDKHHRSLKQLVKSCVSPKSKKKQPK